MKMTLRWFDRCDSVPLKYIRQIPGVKGVVTTLYDIPAGEVWRRKGYAINDEVEQFDLFKILGIESVNIHDAIKVGFLKEILY